MEKSNGYALPVLLVSSAIIAGMLAHLFHLWLEQREQFLSEMKRVNYETEVIEAQKETLFANKSSSDWKTPPLLWSSNQSKPEDRFLNTLLLKKQARPLMSLLPNWDYLRRHSSNSACRQLGSAEQMSGLANARTCTRLGSSNSELAFIDANLVLNRLRFRRQKEIEEFTLAVAGQIQLDVLAFEEADISFTLIALGDIKIKKISTPFVSRGRLLLSSTTGRIEVGEIVPGADLCATTKGNQHLKMRLEAVGTVILGPETLPAGSQGCAFPRTGQTWPFIQLLGSPA